MRGSADLPDDFGLGPIATLSRVADPTPAPESAPCWLRWLKQVASEPRPVLVRREAGVGGVGEVDASDGSATHGLVSFRGVRIGARLLMPPRGVPVRAGLVSTHGYAVSAPLSERDGLFAACVERGVAVLNVRVRGFAGSRLDTGDLTRPSEPGLGWITRGLDSDDESPEAFLGWVYPQAVADVFNACRAMRWWLNESAGTSAALYLHGESFGAGLAVAAAAKITGRADAITHVDRLVLGLPTMGDWRWRLAHPARSGMGAQVARLLRERPGIADLIAARLRVADSVPLASRIRCPVLCKLAERDEVVPAPTAAAVFNALGVDPGKKWRFIVPHGHAQTGLGNARRHAAFDGVAASFFDPGVDPAETMARFEDDLRRPPREDDAPRQAAPEPGLFGASEGGDEAEALLVRAYEAAGRTLDDLPYTPEFEQIYTTVAKALNANRRTVFHRLHNLRKAGRLPRLGRGAGRAPSIDPMEERWLIVEVVEAVGSLGQRDQLPFTPEFDAICQRFNAEHARDLTPHDLWRVVAKLAK